MAETRKQKIAKLKKQKPGLYRNIHLKRLGAGKTKKKRKVGSKGAPTAEAFRRSAKTAKKMNTGGGVKSIKTVPSELRKASKMHANQAKRVASHIKSMKKGTKKRG